MLSPMPIIQQNNSSSCGSACLYACLHYWRKASKLNRESDLWHDLDFLDENGEIDDSGISADKIVDVARSYGLEAFIHSNTTPLQLMGWLESGATPILLLQAHRDDNNIEWEDCWDDSHYVVCIGFDNDKFIFMDPSTHTSYASLDVDELNQRWHSFDDDGNKEYGVCIPIRGNTNQCIKQYPEQIQILG